jgi:hypothetical protein
MQSLSVLLEMIYGCAEKGVPDRNEMRQTRSDRFQILFLI